MSNILNSSISSNVTATDVATAARVSQAAVSRAFTPGAPIAREKREHILAVANELGYRPRQGRARPLGKNAEVAVVITDIGNPFFPPAIELLLHKLHEISASVRVHCVPRGLPLETVIPELFRHRPDGIILAAATFDSDLPQICRQRGIPIVLLNRVFEHKDMSMVSTDNYLGGRQVAELLVRIGCCRVAYLAGRREIPSSAERERGLRDGLQAAGLELFTRLEGEFVYDRAVSVTRQVLKSSDKPDAIFCANDVMALAVIDIAVRERKIDIPGELAIVGFDDIPQASWLSYQLTTVRQRIPIIVQEAVDLLQRMMSDSDSAGVTRLVPGELIERATTPPTA